MGLLICALNQRDQIRLIRAWLFDGSDNTQQDVVFQPLSISADLSPDSISGMNTGHKNLS
jgi:hypothetical protein